MRKDKLLDRKVARVGISELEPRIGLMLEARVMSIADSVDVVAHDWMLANWDVVKHELRLPESNAIDLFRCIEDLDRELEVGWFRTRCACVCPSRFKVLEDGACIVTMVWDVAGAADGAALGDSSTGCRVGVMSFDAPSKWLNRSSLRRTELHSMTA